MHNRPSRNPRSRDWVWVCLLYLAEVTQVMTTHFPTIYEEGDNLHCRTCITITFGITWMGVSSQVFSFFSSSLFFCSHIALFTIKLQLIFNFTWTLLVLSLVQVPFIKKFPNIFSVTTVTVKVSEAALEERILCLSSSQE